MYKRNTILVQTFEWRHAQTCSVQVVEIIKHQFTLIQNPHTYGSWRSTSTPASPGMEKCSTSYLIARKGKLGIKAIYFHTSANI